jgi:hypothetical protein
MATVRTRLGCAWEEAGVALRAELEGMGLRIIDDFDKDGGRTLRCA